MRAIGAVLSVCLLTGVAVAGPSTADRSRFEKTLQIVLAAVMPRMQAVTRERVVRDYLAARPSKALAVLPGSLDTWRSSGNHSLDEAVERALEGCQLRNAKPCALLAFDDEIDAGETKVKDMPRLRYAGVFDIEKIPTIAAITKARLDLQDYSSAPTPKVIAIHPWGTLFISTGKANALAAQDAALNECNADPGRKGKDGNCFVYAINNEVILPERRQIGK